MSADPRHTVELAARLDTAELPLAGSELPADGSYRDALSRLLARRGRTLVHVDVGEEVGQVTTGIADDIAAALSDAGIGTLGESERAALALVLLRCVAEPTAAGHPPATWHLAERVTHQQLKASQLPGTHLTDALRSLQRVGLVDAAPVGVRPGPALARLTPAARRRLERQMVELVAGDDPLIRRVLDNITAGRDTGNRT